MIDVNIDDFYHDIAVILLSLYQQFPQKINLYVEDVCGPDQVDEFGLHSKRHLSCIGAFMWLKDEGYIRYDDIIKQENASECTLTQKAFVTLIRPCPDEAGDSSLKQSSAERFNSTLIQQLHKAIQDRSGLDVRLLIERHFFSL